MKCFTLALLFCILTCRAGAAALVLSTTNNGVYIGIGGWPPHDYIQATDKLAWNAFYDKGEIELTVPLPQYSMRFRMTGPNGRAISLTEVGRKYGLLFDRVHGFEDTTNSSWHPFNHIQTRSASALASPDEIGGIILPSAQELFNMKKPGIYDLEVEMQVFRPVAVSNQWSFKLMRFSPIKLKIQKPED